jgi:peptide/nickel transport system substrate-binding protein
MARVYDTFLRQRLTRRRMLGGAAGLSTAAVVLAACKSGGKGGATPSGASPNPKETPTLGGILHLQQSNAFPSLSPFGPTALASTLVFGFTTYDHLWYVPIDTGVAGEDGKMLASKIEIIDPQGTDIRITMKPAVFHNKPPVNGRAVEPQDVVESWFAFRDDIFGLGRDWLQTIMDKLEQVDANTLHITQKRPWAWMWGTAGAGSPASSSVLPRETITLGKALDTDIFGSGRYQFDSAQAGQNVHLRKFDKWRIPGEPFLGGVDLVYLPQFEQAQAQFAAGGIDELGFQNKPQADQMEGRLGSQMYVTTDLSRAYHAIWVKSVPPFDDPRVRKAMRLAVNRAEMIQLVERDPAGGVNCGIVPPAQKLHALPEDDSDQKEYFRFDKDAAIALLREANFPFDKEFTLLISSPNEKLAERAQVLKEQWAAIGIKTTIDAQDLLSVWVPRVLLQEDYQITLFTHLPYEDPYLPLAFYTKSSPIGRRTDQGRNNMAFYDQEITDAVDATSRELDDSARADKVKAAQRLIMKKEGPMINVYSSVDFTGRRSWYKGISTGRGSFGLFNGRAWIDTGMRGS